jgi:hypothetical protein
MNASRTSIPAALGLMMYGGASAPIIQIVFACTEVTPTKRSPEARAKVKRFVFTLSILRRK